MKKLFTLLAVAFFSITVGHARDIVSEFFHEVRDYVNFRNMVDAKDGPVIAQCPVF